MAGPCVTRRCRPPLAARRRLRIHRRKGPPPRGTGSVFGVNGLLEGSQHLSKPEGFGEYSDSPQVQEFLLRISAQVSAHKAAANLGVNGGGRGQEPFSQEPFLKLGLPQPSLRSLTAYPIFLFGTHGGTIMAQAALVINTDVGWAFSGGTSQGSSIVHGGVCRPL